VRGRNSATHGDLPASFGWVRYTRPHFDTQAVGNRDSRHDGAVIQQDRELLAAKSPQQIARAHGQQQHLRDVTQHLVACATSVAIIDRFEVIDVEIDQGGG
jgi:hypothetical protein